jgi:hypothetical protein
VRRKGWFAVSHAGLLGVAVVGLSTGAQNDARYRAVAARVERTDSRGHALGLQRLARRLVDGRAVEAPEADEVREDIEPNQACGAYAGTLARLLRVHGYDVRIAQMLDAPGDAGEALHILVEVEIDGRWVVLDPSYGLAFRRPDGALASFADVQADWPSYAAQVPPGYDPRYRYAGVRYTNWGKVPVLLPAFREVLRLFLGDRVDTLSVRVYLLDGARVAGVLALVASALVLSGQGLARILRRRRASPGAAEETRAIANGPAGDLVESPAR